MSLPSDFQQRNILRRQEVHIGNPEYRPHRHQRGLKNCTALRQVILEQSAMAGFLRHTFLPIVSVPICRISCRLSCHCLSQSILFQVTLATSFGISSISKLLPSCGSFFRFQLATHITASRHFLRGPQTHVLSTDIRSDMSLSWNTWSGFPVIAS